MLKSLTVDNFALIHHVQIEFAAGLNILTGETGAGKSILIDALGIILGERASTELIRRDCDYLRVEAVVDLAAGSPLADFLDEQGIPREEDLLIISRRLLRNGKNTVLVNGCQTTLAVLRQIGELLVDMHGQHENQALLRPQAHLSLVDHFAAAGLLLSEYKAVYEEWQTICAELTDYETRARERERRLEMLAWQVDEIEQAVLLPNEDEQCEQEIRLLANSEKVTNAVSRSYVLLQTGDRGSLSALSALGEVRRELEGVLRFDDTLRPFAESIAECLYQLEDAANELRHYTERTDFNPARLQLLEDRLDLIQGLKRKYGSSITEICAYQLTAAAELASLQNAAQNVEQLLARRQERENQLTQLAADLDRMRRQAADDLSQAVTAHLRELGMPNAVFSIDVSLTEPFLPTGRNEVLCLFSANRGEEPKPLQKVASGGELSRIALAIKSVSAYRDVVGTVVFDEVDAGIGGKTAQMVAEKIALVSQNKQVLCITHSPPIASMADVHFLVEKSVDLDRTITLVRQLSPIECTLELARMVAGDSSQIAVDNARQMIETARKKKEKWTEGA